MRATYDELVRARFAEQMSKLLPQFEPAVFSKSHSDILYFRLRLAADLTFYIGLTIDEKDDRFSVRLTWMTNDLLPIEATPGGLASKPNKNGLTISLGLLWAGNDTPWKVKYSPSDDELAAWLKANTSDGHSEFGDELTRKVYPRVDDAIKKIMEYGLPYFKSVALDRGYQGAWAER
jgi:hypothetical protein